MTSGLEEIGASLRSAVQSGSYTEAEAILAQYSCTVQDAAVHFPPGDAQAIEIIRQAIELLHWTTRMVRAGRAHTADQLAQLSASRPYRAPAAGPTATFTLNG